MLVSGRVTLSDKNTQKKLSAVGCLPRQFFDFPPKTRDKLKAPQASQRQGLVAT